MLDVLLYIILTPIALLALLVSYGIVVAIVKTVKQSLFARKK